MNHTTLAARCVVSKYSHKQCYFCCVLVFAKIQSKKELTVVSKGREWDKGESQHCVDPLAMTWSVVSEGWMWQQMRWYVHWHSSMLQIGTWGRQQKMEVSGALSISGITYSTWTPLTQKQRCMGKTPKYSCYCDNNTEYESRTTPAYARASQVS